MFPLEGGIYLCVKEGGARRVDAFFARTLACLRREKMSVLSSRPCFKTMCELHFS